MFVKEIHNGGMHVDVCKEVYMQTQAGMAYSYIPKVHSVVFGQLHATVTMDKIEGETVQDSIMRSKGYKQYKSIVQKWIEALKAIHSVGVYHGDVNIDNAMLDSDGNLYLIDFSNSNTLENNEESAVEEQVKYCIVILFMLKSSVLDEEDIVWWRAHHEEFKEKYDSMFSFVPCNDNFGTLFVDWPGRI